MNAVTPSVQCCIAFCVVLWQVLVALVLVSIFLKKTGEDPLLAAFPSLHQVCSISPTAQSFSMWPFSIPYSLIRFHHSPPSVSPTHSLTRSDSPRISYPVSYTLSNCAWKDQRHYQISCRYRSTTEWYDCCSFPCPSPEIVQDALNEVKSGH